MLRFTFSPSAAAIANAAAAAVAATCAAAAAAAAASFPPRFPVPAKSLFFSDAPYYMFLCVCACVVPPHYVSCRTITLFSISDNDVFFLKATRDLDDNPAKRPEGGFPGDVRGALHVRGGDQRREVGTHLCTTHAWAGGSVGANFSPDGRVQTRLKPRRVV